MIDSYILLNRKVSFLNTFFIYSLIILIFVVIYSLYNIPYTTYYIYNSRIVYENNNYYIKFKALSSDIKYINTNNTLIIDNKKYNYNIYKVDYKNNNGYQYVYLSVLLDKSYLINNYSVKVKIFKDQKKLIEYIKEG